MLWGSCPQETHLPKGWGVWLTAQAGPANPPPFGNAHFRGQAPSEPDPPEEVENACPWGGADLPQKEAQGAWEMKNGGHEWVQVYNMVKLGTKDTGQRENYNCRRQSQAQQKK